MNNSGDAQDIKSDHVGPQTGDSQSSRPEPKTSLAEKVWSDIKKATLYGTLIVLSFFAGKGISSPQPPIPPCSPPISQPAPQNQDQELTRKVTEAVDALQRLPKTTDAKEQEQLRRTVEDAVKALNEAEAKRPSPLVAQLKQLFIAVGGLILTTVIEESLKTFTKRMLDSLKSTSPSSVTRSPEQSNNRRTNSNESYKFSYRLTYVTV
jgi:hypothetical protein